MTEQYLRAHNLLETEGLLERYTEGALLGAKCLMRANDPDGALDLIGEEEEPMCIWQEEDNADTLTVKLSSRTASLRASIFEQVENRAQAAHWYVQAMRRDAMNYEAFQAVISKQLLNAEQEDELSHVVRKNVIMSESMLWEMYGCKLNIYSSGAEKTILENDCDSDLMTALANALYQNCQIEKSLKVCKKVFDLNSDNSTLITVYLACLVEKEEANELYYLAHQLGKEKEHRSILILIFNNELSTIFLF